MSGPTSRAWFDELRLGPVVAAALREYGLDEGRAWSAVERVRVLLTLPRPTNVRGRSATERTHSVARAWLDDPGTRAFLRVHRWQEVEWLDGDAWLELARWARELDAVDAAGPDSIDRRGGGATVRRSGGRAARGTDLAGLAQRAGYRVDALRELAARRSKPPMRRLEPPAAARSRRPGRKPSS